MFATTLRSPWAKGLAAASIPVLLSAAGVSAAAKQEPVKLTFLVWGSQENVPIREAIVKAFEESHPNIKVETIFAPSGYWDKLNAMIAAGTPPDVFWLSYQDVPSYVEKGMLYNLKELADKDPEFQSYKKEYLPIVLQGYEYEGGFYGLPNAYNPLLVYYNQDLFDEAGVVAPTKAWTWDEFIRAAQKMTGGDRWGFIPNGYWLPFLWQAGGEVLSADRKKVTINSTQAIEGLQFFQDLAFRHKVAPPPGAVTMSARDLFARGYAAMYVDGGWRFPAYMDQGFTVNWGVVPYPKKVREATQVAYDGGVVFSGTKHPKEAWELVKFYSGPKGQAINARASHLTTPVVQSTFLDSMRNSKWQKQLMARWEQSTSGRLYPSIPRQSEMNTIFASEIAQLTSGEKAARQVAQSIAERLAPILKPQ